MDVAGDILPIQVERVVDMLLAEHIKLLLDSHGDTELYL
jgi:hypothetical protein